MIEFQEFPHLVSIPRSQNYFVPVVPQLLDDRKKERDMWGIVNIDPDSSWYIQSRRAVGTIHPDTVGQTRIYHDCERLCVAMGQGSSLSIPDPFVLSIWDINPSREPSSQLTKRVCQPASSDSRHF
jgi:hypothetical protein